ncbi:DUF3592 domain-containing protein [Aeoliella mucimassa]|uniref:DUF3592 domain-containing protein n=1 Tax=Aeoliella mucimassa TaxID=2527972 RepID=A0A518AWP9_9BACT|nr:DUF3592 domain-containing protein [Aeoliella mucimassa]QDU59154.1 hypothetical protein Pan181_53950 [Aeoliella mucimassa]
MEFVEKLIAWATLNHLIGLGMALFGAVGLAWSSYKAWLGGSSLFWREAVGEIIEVSVKQQRDHDGDRVYAPRVDYRYQVNSVDYENKEGQFRVIETRSSKTWATEQTKPYAMGERVVVYYNPWCHSQSVLEQGCSLIVLVVWGVALATLLGGLFLLGLLHL